MVESTILTNDVAPRYDLALGAEEIPYHPHELRRGKSPKRLHPARRLSITNRIVPGTNLTPMTKNKRMAIPSTTEH